MKMLAMFSSVGQWVTCTSLEASGNPLANEMIVYVNMLCVCMSGLCVCGCNGALVVNKEGHRGTWRHAELSRDEGEVMRNSAALAFRKLRKVFVCPAKPS